MNSSAIPNGSPGRCQDTIPPFLLVPLCLTWRSLALKIYLGPPCSPGCWGLAGWASPRMTPGGDHGPGIWSSGPAAGLFTGWRELGSSRSHGARRPDPPRVRASLGPRGDREPSGAPEALARPYRFVGQYAARGQPIGFVRWPIEGKPHRGGPGSRGTRSRDRRLAGRLRGHYPDRAGIAVPAGLFGAGVNGRLFVGRPAPPDVGEMVCRGGLNPGSPPPPARSRTCA